MSEVSTRATPGTSLRGFSAPIVLTGGVFVIPILLGLLFNSWSTPDAAAYVRMAFASVAGGTIAIVTVVGLLVHRVARQAPASTIAILGVIAVFVTLASVQGIASAADLLVLRLNVPQ